MVMDIIKDSKDRKARILPSVHGVMVSEAFLSEHKCWCWSARYYFTLYTALFAVWMSEKVFLRKTRVRPCVQSFFLCVQKTLCVSYECHDAVLGSRELRK